MTFFDSGHCVSRAHCAICRDRESGRTWRRLLQGAFPDLHQADFDCPQGLPWGTGPQKLRRAPSGLTYIEVAERIREAPAEPPWIVLKDELRLLEDFLQLHAHRPSCWKSHQRRRLVAWFKAAAPSLQPAP